MMLEVGGVRYDNFVSAQCSLRLDSLADSFNFEAVNPDGAELPFKGGELCRVYVDGELVLTGHIEIVAVVYDGESHSITIQGRSKPADLLDSTIGLFDDVIGEGLTLKGLIEKVIAHLSLDLSVIDEVNPRPFNGAEDLAAPEAGDNAFSFIEKYTRKRQVLLKSSPEGNILITTNSGINAAGKLQHIIGATDNNIISSSFSYDTTGRYNAYRLASQLNPIPLNLTGDSDLAPLVNQGGGVFDSDIRQSRQLVIISEAPLSDTECEARARWEADVRKARGLIYSATVPYFREGGLTGEIWRLNRIYQVVDDFIGKVEPMLCNAVTFSLDEESGRNTQVGLIGRNAYLLSLVDEGDVADAVYPKTLPSFAPEWTKPTFVKKNPFGGDN